MIRARAAALLLLTAASDPRVRVVTYAVNEVVPVRGHYGYQILISFAPDERIGNISIGDSSAWLVTPNKEDNGLFLKPVEPRASTNMTVQTDRRTYLFELAAAQPSRGGTTPGMLYKLEFRYPQPAPATSPMAAYNRAYKISGAAALRPLAVFDDGRATYFAWGPATPIPAILALDGRQESLVNVGTRGGYVVVDRTARAFVLRSGRATAKVTNQTASGSAKEAR